MAMDIAREFGPEGIHVAHVVIDGQIDTPGVRERFTDRDDETFLDPDGMAETDWHLVERDDVSTQPFEVHITNGPGNADVLMRFSVAASTVFSPSVTTVFVFALEKAGRRFVGGAGLFDRVPGLAVSTLLAGDVVGGGLAFEVRARLGLDDVVVGLLVGADELGRPVLVPARGRATGRTHHLVALGVHQRTAVVAELDHDG
jgi:hypothetical protein